MFNLSVYSILIRHYQGKTENFGHPALKELIHEVFYKGDESLARLYPGSFSHSVPVVAVLLAATAVCLNFPCQRLTEILVRSTAS